MPNIKSFIGGAGVLAVIGWSAAAFAGGHGGMMPVRPVAHAGAQMPHVNGGGRGWGGLRGARGPASWARFGGVGTLYGSRFGHTNTAPFGRWATFPRAGWPGWAGRDLRLARLGYGRRRLAGYAFAPRGLRQGTFLPGSIGAGQYDVYDYGAGLGSAGYSTGYGLGFAEPSLAATYAEPPLGPSPYAGQGGLSFEEDGGYAPPPGYGGGPRIISVRADERLPPARECSCSRASGQGPVVYRFGVGTFY